MRLTSGVQTRLILFGLVAGLAARADGQRPSAARTPGTSVGRPSSASDSLYSTDERDFVVGKTVYLRSSKTRIGTIVRTDANHSFPRTFPRPRMKAVLIRRMDGPYEWTPVEGITRIYVVNK